ncbi:hypothetical protein [Streptosporangium fragile]
MTTVRRKPLIGTGLLVVALLLLGVSIFLFLRASDTQERIDGHLQKATGLLSEAESVKETDPGRHDELTREANRYTWFAETDQEEHSSQYSSAWLLAAGAAGCLTGGLIVFLSRGGRAPRGAKFDRV